MTGIEPLTPSSTRISSSGEPVHECVALDLAPLNVEAFALARLPRRAETRAYP